MKRRVILLFSVCLLLSIGLISCETDEITEVNQEYLRTIEPTDVQPDGDGANTGEDEDGGI